MVNSYVLFLYSRVTTNFRILRDYVTPSRCSGGLSTTTTQLHQYFASPAIVLIVFSCTDILLF